LLLFRTSHSFKLVSSSAQGPYDSKIGKPGLGKLCVQHNIYAESEAFW